MFKLNDGGRAKAGYKGLAGDCGARAIAIALALDYQVAYDLLALANQSKGYAKSARNGVYKAIYSEVLASLGWVWHSAPKFDGRKARCYDLPSGAVIAQQAGHFVAVIDGMPHDVWDCSQKMVYGYWFKQSA
jgi:hypothetical protein